MIYFTSGNIFESPARVLVNPVNTVGVMGKGLALAFKKRYFNMFDQYLRHCLTEELQVGTLLMCHENDHDILCFPTKKHWRSPSRLEYIEEGLKTFVDYSKRNSIKTIAFPRLGCGLGGLSWEKQVKPLMIKYLSDLEIDIYIYE